MNKIPNYVNIVENLFLEKDALENFVVNPVLHLLIIQVENYQMKPNKKYLKLFKEKVQILMAL